VWLLRSAASRVGRLIGAVCHRQGRRPASAAAQARAHGVLLPTIQPCVALVYRFLVSNLIIYINTPITIHLPTQKERKAELVLFVDAVGTASLCRSRPCHQDYWHVG